MKILGYFSFSLLILFSQAATASAGGGQYHPLNFSYDQVIQGRSLDIEVEIHKDDYSGMAIGEDFEIIAHHDLPGASCQTTPRTSDNLGRIKGHCSANGDGRFIFEIVPISKRTVQSGSTFQVNFSQQQTNTGYPEQGNVSVDKYDAVITQSPSEVNLGERFAVEAKLRKDGNITEDDHKIQSVRWTVLKGSMVSFGSEGAGNRKLYLLTDDRNTVIIADITLTSGEQLRTASKAIAYKPIPTPKLIVPATPKATSIPAQKKSLNQPTTKPKAIVSPHPAIEATYAPTTIETPLPSASPKTKEKTIEKQLMWKRVWNWIVWWD